MYNLRYIATVFFLFASFGITGCAGGLDSVQSAMSKTVSNIKAGHSEQTGDEAYYQQKNFPAAFTAYQKAAETGGRYGQFMLANMYLSGEGVKRDPLKYLHWMRKSAENGYPPANYLMGMVYISRDAMAASKYFEVAAGKEHGGAMHMLGMMYARGIGVQQSDKEAVRWFRMAKAQGVAIDDRLLSEATMREYIVRIKRNAPQSRATAQGDKKAVQIKTAAPPPVKEISERENAAASQPETVKTETMNQKQLIREVQQYLTKLGYNPGTIDGMMGGKTRNAIKAFQRKKGMRVDGLATETLLDALRAL